MEMKLCRNSKTGKIKDKNILPIKKIAVGAGFGALMICGIVGYSKVSDDDLNRYSSYSEQIEALYDVDISSSNEEILNSMQENLDLVNQYNEALTDEERYDALEKMMETKSKLTDSALTIIKREYLEEYGGDIEQYDIHVNYRDNIYVARKHNSKNDTYECFSLNGKQQKLVDYVTKLDDASYSKESEIGKDSKEFVERYESVIKESAKYLGKTSDKAK